MFVCTIEEAEAEAASVDALGDEIASLAAHISAATCRWLGLIAEFDERLGWAAAGASSCAAWVSWRCGVAPGTAREHVRVARRLQELPLVGAAFAAGELSYAKARALTRVEAIKDEAELVELARHANAAQLERIVRAFRSVTREDAADAYADRCLELFTDSDGTLHINGRLPAELGATVMAAVLAAEELLRWPVAAAGNDAITDASPRPEPVPAGALRADALAALAQAATGHTTITDGETAPRLARGAVQVTVHVDAATLTDPGPDDVPAGTRDRICEVEAGPPLAAETVRRLCCDAGIVPVVRGSEGEVLSVGRRTRSIPPAIRRALAVRDDGCRFPGCVRRRWLHAHHIEHWAHGGHTELKNLVLLCRHHHQLVHEGGWQLIVTPGIRSVDALAPDGHHVPAVPSPPSPDSTAAGKLPPGDPQALYPKSAGAPWDLGLAVDALLAWTERPPDPGGR